MCIDDITYKHLVILIMKFLEEENCRESLQALEQESKIFFNLNYFGETIISGEWDRAEKYLSAFTKLDDNGSSTKLFFELRKQKYYEALYRDDCTEAGKIFQKELEPLSAFENRICGELAKPFSLKDLRHEENKQLSWHTNATTSRAELLDDIKVLVKRNPVLQDKLVFPSVNKSALLSLINLICPSFDNKTRSIKDELVYLILQFLDEEEFKETLHKFERDTKIFFDMNYFVEHIINGRWDKAEKYLSAFTKMDDNNYSTKMFAEMQMQKYLRTVDRQNKLPSEYAQSSYLCNTIKVLVEKNPLLQDKLKFPSMDKSRLLKLIRQTMDWWVPNRVKMMPNAVNGTFSLKDIPTVPYLLHAPSFGISNSSHKGIPAPSGNGSNNSSCFTDVNQSRENTRLADANSPASMKPTEKSVIWKLLQINGPSECCVSVLPDDSLGERVVRLIYSCTGDFVLALTQNATHKIWRQSNQYSSKKENANVQPFLCQSSNEIIMRNEIGAHPKDSVSCFALKDSFLFSASGGKISIFNLETYETLASFANPPPTATYFIFLPEDLFAIGFDDSSILIHCPYTKKTKAKLKGHQNQITCLTFSHHLNVLVSAGADAQLCVWDANGWKKLCSKYVQNVHTGLVPEIPSVNHMHFHPNQIHVLVVSETQIDVFEAPTLNQIVQLVPDKLDLPITCATYSCDGKLLYISCKSGCIKVFAAATFDLRCQINLSAYAQPSIGLEVYPLVVVAHPSEPNQIALGLTNGGVHVLEPLQSEVQWGTLPPVNDS